MIQKESAIVPSTIFEIKSGCEKLITETQNDIQIFKIEQTSFRESLVEISEENQRLKKQLEVIQNSNSLFECSRYDTTLKECSTDIIEMLKQEIESFRTENDELKSIQDYLRKTIYNHEKEIESYRDFVFGNGLKNDERENLNFIQKLESELSARDSELNEKSMYIQSLETQKQMLLDEIELIKAELKAAKIDSTHQINFNKKCDLTLESNREKFALQASLQSSSLKIAEHMEKERMALQKMGEALGIAEAAFQEKEAVLKNKAILEKERDFLASTIGQVMEEASQKVDRQMQKMNRKLAEYQKKLEMLNAEYTEKMGNQLKAHNCIEVLLKCTQNENKELLIENQKLKKARDVMQQALEKIGIKVQTNGVLLYEDNDHKHVIDQLKSEIKQINLKCKMTIEDITHEFQKTVTRISSENAELKAQLKMLRGQCQGF